MSEYKICANCGTKVDIDYNFCPNCKSQSFLEQPVAPSRANPPSAVAKTLLYWDYDGQYVLAKSKICAIGVFIWMFLSGLPGLSLAATFFAGLIFATITFVLGYVIHAMKGKPSQATIDYNNYGVLPDLYHLFFFWQNKITGEFVPSKTKIITAIIFIISLIIMLVEYNPLTFFIMVFAGLFFGIPAFLVGCGIHKLTNSNPTNPPKKFKPKKEPKRISKNKEKIPEVKKVEPPKEVIPKFDEYRSQIKELESEYTEKDKVARKLIEKRFEPPQLTYTRFITIVDKAAELFDKEADAANNILDLASEDSPRIDKEISAKINILNSIIDKIEDLTNELVLSMDSSKKEDVDNLIGDMEDLISSVKDYHE
ncbi:MAG: hypothetical protein IJF83_13865 [Methanobrevibacter sp.]|nr:hypothetical protein [Methanobrevibacter sp.]